MGLDADIIGTNKYDDIEGGDLCIVVAGLPLKPGMSRDDLLAVNTKIMLQVVEAVGSSCRTHRSRSPSRSDPTPVLQKPT